METLPKTQPSADFRRTFRTFPGRFEEYSFDHWYLFPLVFIVVGFLPLIIIDIQQGATIAGDFSYFILTHLDESRTYAYLREVGLNFLWITAAFLIAWPFNQWRKTIPATFEQLVKRTANADRAKQQDFLATYQATLLSPQRYIIIFLFVLGISLVLVPSQISNVIDLENTPVGTLVVFAKVLEGIRIILANVLIPIGISYAIGAGFWVIFVTSTYIKTWTQAFEIVVQPSHPDRSGGFKFLGNFFVGMVLPVGMGVVLLALFSSGVINYVPATWQTIGDIVLLLFIVPILFMVYWLPLWRFHQKLVAQQRHYEDTIGVRLAALEARILASLAAGDLGQAKASEAELEIVRSLYPKDDGFPTWPFNLGNTLAFVLAQVLSILGFVAGLIIQNNNFIQQTQNLPVGR